MSSQNFKLIFSKNLNYYLNINCISQVELAKYVDVSTASVSNWCKGIKFPRMDKIDKMCSIFQIKRSDLIEEHIFVDTFCNSKKSATTSLGYNIRYLRLQKGYSQDFVAKQLGYKSYTTIQKWESGVSEPPIKKLKELSILFNTNISNITNSDLEDFSNHIKAKNEFYIASSISERIKEAMRLSNMKQADLVERTGISKGALSSYISGRYLPKQTNLYLIAKALNVNEAWLIGFDVPMKRNEFLGISDKPHSMYIHFDETDYTKDELDEIKQFAEFIKNRRKL